jgi:Rrf2 family nitric oxide-sensitive transcriptional repressor
VELSDQGLLETTRGRGGGLRLLKPAKDIVLGQVVRKTETDFTMVECFDPASSNCRLTGHCRLKSVLRDALQSYLQVLDSVTLADLVPSSGAGLPALPKRQRSVKLTISKDR